MERIITIDQLRVIAVSGISPILAYFTPTGGFLLGLFAMFSLNVWCGMRADGVSVVTCKNFSWNKFRQSMVELLLYVVIIEVMYLFMRSIDEPDNGILLIKTMTVVCSYVYLQNSFKNLIHAYPRIRTFRVVYHLIRFEFSRAMPAHVQRVIERIDNEIEKNKEEKK